MATRRPADPPNSLRTLVAPRNWPGVMTLARPYSLLLPPHEAPFAVSSSPPLGNTTTQQKFMPARLNCRSNAAVRHVLTPPDLPGAAFTELGPGPPPRSGQASRTISHLGNRPLLLADRKPDIWYTSADPRKTLNRRYQRQPLVRQGRALWQLGTPRRYPATGNA